MWQKLHGCSSEEPDLEMEEGAYARKVVLLYRIQYFHIVTGSVAI